MKTIDSLKKLDKFTVYSTYSIEENFILLDIHGIVKKRNTISETNINEIIDMYFKKLCLFSHEIETTIFINNIDDNNMAYLLKNLFFNHITNIFVFLKKITKLLKKSKLDRGNAILLDETFIYTDLSKAKIKLFSQIDFILDQNKDCFIGGVTLKIKNVTNQDINNVFFSNIKLKE